MNKSFFETDHTNFKVPIFNLGWALWIDVNSHANYSVRITRLSDENSTFKRGLFQNLELSIRKNPKTLDCMKSMNLGIIEIQNMTA